MYLQIDELLEDAGIAVSGTDACDWVAISYEGLVLYPTADQLRESGTIADCAAAFVSASMAMGTSDSGSDSDPDQG